MPIKIRLPEASMVQDEETKKYLNGLVREINNAFETIVVNTDLYPFLRDSLIEASGISLTFDDNTETVSVATSA